VSEDTAPAAVPAPRTRLVLVRHGESNSTVARVIGGFRTCTGLSPLGRKQTEALAERLARTGEVRADALIASAYPRAIDTAELIASALGDLEVVVDAEVGEHDPGPENDGLTFTEFLGRHGMPDWEHDPHAVVFPGGGETLAEFHHRVGRALHRIAAEHAGRTAVIVCHGGVIDVAFRHLLRLPSFGAFELRTTNTSLTELVLVRAGRWQLARYNDAAHLAGLPLETARADEPS
jgi:2,3-bisphosphoglycerate-dependent phosphoglycerate mutase